MTDRLQLFAVHTACLIVVLIINNQALRVCLATARAASSPFPIIIPYYGTLSKLCSSDVLYGTETYSTGLEDLRYGSVLPYVQRQR